MRRAHPRYERRVHKYLLGLALIACDGAGELPVDAATVDAAPREVVVDDRTLLIGDLAEGTLTGGPGDRAAITLTASAPKLDWNLHGHAGGGTQTITEQLAIDHAEYTFEPTAQAEWSLLLRNANTDSLVVHVEIQLYGDIVWNGWAN